MKITITLLPGDIYSQLNYRFIGFQVQGIHCNHQNVPSMPKNVGNDHNFSLDVFLG